MITNRSTVQVKHNCLKDFTALILAEAKHANLQHGFRLYMSEIGPRNVHVLELDFEDLAAYERFWRDWVRFDPAFEEKYLALVEHDIASEIWMRAE